MLHVEAVTHLVGQRSRLDADVVRMDHYNRSGTIAGAHSTQFGFPDHVVLELDRRQQLGVIVPMVPEQLLAAILQEVVQRVVCPSTDLDLVVSIPHVDTGKGDEDVQLVEQLKQNVRLRRSVITRFEVSYHVDVIHDIGAVTMHFPNVRVELPVQ